MNISTYKEYLAYTHWANYKVIAWLEQLTEQQLTKPVISSFGSILETVHHIISAEHVWIQRITGDTLVWLQPTLPQNLEGTVAQWQATMQLWHHYATTLTEITLENRISFKRLNGEKIDMKICNAVMHCQNHSTQHRGQLITMLRQVGFTNISSLDLFTYYTNIN